VFAAKKKNPIAIGQRKITNSRLPESLRLTSAAYLPLVEVVHVSR